jgi:hypothetical protein
MKKLNMLLKQKSVSRHTAFDTNFNVNIPLKKKLECECAFESKLECVFEEKLEYAFEAEKFNPSHT